MSDPDRPQTTEAIDEQMKQLREQKKELRKVDPAARTKYLTILVSATEKEQLSQVALARGFKSVSEYIRKRCGLED